MRILIDECIDCVPAESPALLQLPTQRSQRSEPWHSRAILAPGGD